MQLIISFIIGFVSQFIEYKKCGNIYEQHNLARVPSMTWWPILFFIYFVIAG